MTEELMTRSCSHYERLPIFKGAMDLVVSMDKVVCTLPGFRLYMAKDTEASEQAFKEHLLTQINF